MFPQNFVGVLESDATRAILATLLQNFRQCRVFHDKDVGNDKRRAPTDFLDLVRQTNTYAKGTC